MGSHEERRFVGRVVAATNRPLAGLLGGYCRRLHDRLGTYEAVARVTGLDRRTVKRHVDGG